MVYVITVYMVLHHVLMNPVNSTASDPILRQAQYTIDQSVPGNGAVVGVVLYVQSYQRVDPTYQCTESDRVCLVHMHIILKIDTRANQNSHLQKVMPWCE